MFKITVDPSYTIIESRLSGFLTVAEVEAYAQEVEPLIQRCEGRGGYRMLIDVAGCAIQSQEVVTAFKAHVARVPFARRLAVVTGDSIVRMQVRRIMSSPRMELFNERAEAMAWLGQIEARRPSA